MQIQKMRTLCFDDESYKLLTTLSKQIKLSRSSILREALSQYYNSTINDIERKLVIVLREKAKAKGMDPKEYFEGLVQKQSAASTG